jgi:hypothetical protein
VAGPPAEPPPEWETPRWQNESPPPPSRPWQEEPQAPQQQWPDEPAWQPEEPRWPEQPYAPEQQQGYGQQEPAYPDQTYQDQTYPDQTYQDQAYQQPYAPDQPRYPEEPPAEPAFPEPRFGGPPYGGSPYAGSPYAGSPYAEQQPPWMGSGQGQYDQQYDQGQYEPNQYGQNQYDQSQYEPERQQQEPPPRMGPAPTSGEPRNRKKLIIIVAAVAALGLAGGGAYVLMDKGSGSSGSETPHSSAWLDDAKPAASGKTVGGAAGDKNFPLSFDVPAGWNSATPGAAAGDYKPVATVKAPQGATLTVVRAPDGAPEDAVRKYAAASGGASGLITRQMDAAGAHGGEGQWLVSGQRHRAIAVSHTGAVYLVVLVTADASYRTDLPAYLLARNSLTFS